MDPKFSNAGDIDANSRVHSVVLSGFGNSAVQTFRKISVVSDDKRQFDKASTA